MFRSVIYYIHEGNDNEHRAVDSAAILLRETDTGEADLVVFPIGGPTLFTRVSKWTADGEPDPVGYAYWREADEAPPDFEEVEEKPVKEPDPPKESDADRLVRMTKEQREKEARDDMNRRV